jgi:hypothetical protein
MQIEPIEITVGGPGAFDPAAGSTDCLIPELRGLQLLIEKRNFGPLKAAEFQPLPAGGFRLIAPFQAGEVYFVFRSGLSYQVEDSGYTNGFQFAKVISALFGRLGWRADTTAGAPVPSADNSLSRSGRYFNDFHALCTLSNIKQILTDPKATDLQINQELEAMQSSVIMRALNGVLNEPELLESGWDFVRDGEQNDRTIENQGLFVGRRIALAPLEDQALQLDRVGLYFDQDVSFPLHLFREGQAAPLATLQVQAIAWQKTAVDIAGWVLSFQEGFGAAYYVGYFQNDLGAARAIDESRSGPPEMYSWACELIQAKQTGAASFDRHIRQGCPWSSGLNLRFSAFRDWTYTITRKAALFDELVGLSTAALIVEKAIHTVRSNSTERALKDQLVSLGFMDLTGAFPAPDGPKVTGLRQMIEREAKRVKKSFYNTPRGAVYSNSCWY